MACANPEVIEATWRAQVNQNPRRLESCLSRWVSELEPVAVTNLGIIVGLTAAGHEENGFVRDDRVYIRYP